MFYIYFFSYLTDNCYHTEVKSGSFHKSALSKKQQQNPQNILIRTDNQNILKHAITWIFCKTFLGALRIPYTSYFRNKIEHFFHSLKLHNKAEISNSNEQYFQICFYQFLGKQTKT